MTTSDQQEIASNRRIYIGFAAGLSFAIALNVAFYLIFATPSEADAAKWRIPLKGNQGRLHGEVESFLEDLQVNGFAGVAHDFLETSEKGHGRRETRRYWITEESAWLTAQEQWANLRSIGMVESTRENQGQSTTERRFYISSLRADAPTFARAVRGHWAIENSLHWSLDVSFGEDQCRVRVGHAAENFAILRHLALHLLKADPTKKVGLKAKQKCAGWDHHYLLSLLSI